MHNLTHKVINIVKYIVILIDLAQGEKYIK